MKKKFLLQYSGYIFYSLYIIVPAGLFRPGPSNAEHVDCPFDHAYHIIPPNNWFNYVDIYTATINTLQEPLFME